ncbi:PAS domain S-box protein [Massilia horti]|nr:PAS domain S-box protein [Massilia horti]
MERGSEQRGTVAEPADAAVAPGGLSAPEVLRESEERFRALAEGLAQAVWETDALGRVVTDSPSWRAYTGQSLEQWLGYGWIDATHPDDRAHALSLWQQAIAARRGFNSEFRMRKADGSWSWTNVRAVPLFDASGNLHKWLGMSLDIDDRRRAQEALREHAARQEFMLALSDALRPLADAAAIEQVACRLLAERLGASRAYYAECNIKEGTCIVRRDYVRAGAASQGGMFRLGDLCPVPARLANGQMLVIYDTLDGSMVPSRAGARCAAAGVRAQATVPLVKGGELVATLSLSQDTPRNWTLFELSLLQETAERTWSAVARAHAEVALRESEARYRSLFESMDQGYALGELVRDAQGEAVDYRLLEINPSWGRLLGMSAEGVVGQTRNELWPVKDEQAVRMYAEVVASGQPLRREYFAPALGRWYDLHVLPRGVDRFAVLFDDISARKRNEAKLAFLADLGDAVSEAASESEVVAAAGQRVGAFFGVQHFYLIELDEAAGTADIAYSWQAEGMPPLPAHLTIALFESEQFARAVAVGKTVAVGDVRASGHSVAASYDQLRIRSYVKVPLYRQGRRSVLAVVAASEPRDWKADEIELIRECVQRVGARVQKARAEAALRESEARFRALAEASPALIWQLGPDGGAMYFNQRYLDVTGMSVSELLDNGWHQVIHPDDLQTYAAAADEALQQRKPFQMRVRCKVHDGQWHWFESSAMPWFSDDGQYRGLVGISIDVTEAVLAEESLREADRRKDEFLATLAHELRNPLAPISNAVHLLRQPDGRRRADRIVEMVGRQVQQIVRLVDDLMEVSRITRGKIELERRPLALGEVLAAAVETSLPAIEQASHRLEVALPDEPLVVAGDRVRLTQVFTNLLNNAARYTDRGGRICVGARREEGWAVITVRDNGMGIAPEQLPHVFEMFVQLHRPASRGPGGLGIGLTMVRNLVEMHGGQVEASSAGPGQGSEFRVRLPLLAPDALSPPADTRHQAGAPLAGRRVLIVDDNRDAADSLSLLLASKGADAKAVYDGESGLALLPILRPHVLVLDIGMPRLNGHEVARRVRDSGRFPGLCIIALTGWGQQADRQQSRISGFDHHLTKPVDLASLERLIADCGQDGEPNRSSS